MAPPLGPPSHFNSLRFRVVLLVLLVAVAYFFGTNLQFRRVIGPLHTLVFLRSFFAGVLWPVSPFFPLHAQFIVNIWFVQLENYVDVSPLSVFSSLLLIIQISLISLNRRTMVSFI